MGIDALVSLAFVVAGYVIGWCVRDYVQHRREARAKGSWGWMIGKAVNGYADPNAAPVESLGRAE